MEDCFRRIREFLSEIGHVPAVHVGRRTTTISNTDAGKVVINREQHVVDKQVMGVVQSVQKFPGMNNPDGEIQEVSRTYGSIPN